MNNKSIKVIDDHNIDRNANVMFAMDLEGSEYVVYWIERDETSNNVFVSKVLKNNDGTYNMINIDDDDKKKDVADTVKLLISNAVSDQNDKLTGISVALSNGKTVKFIDVSFNKEQNINVSKTYITTVKKEVTKVSEDYYDVVVEEANVADVLSSVTPVTETVTDVFPELGSAVSAPVVAPTPVISAAPVMETVSVVQPQPVVQSVPQQTVVVPSPVVTPSVVIPAQAQVISTSAVDNVSQVVMPVSTVAAAPVVTPTPVVAPTPIVQPQPIIPEPVVQAVPQQTVVPTPVIPANQPLVFDAAKETNLNAALGEVANSATISVDNIAPVREFGVDTPVVQSQPVVTPMVQPVTTEIPKTLTKKAGFANSKFFVVVAIAFFLASCIFLGYEVYKYFQLTK